VWLNAGRAYDLAPGFSDKAVAVLEQALALGKEQQEVNPRDALLLVGLADVHCMLGHSGEARELANRALELAPENGEVLAVAAAIREELGDRETAIGLVVRALEAGYSRWEIDHDPFLKTLREDPTYPEAVAAVSPDAGPPA
jgi:tetratricopeptide (TPR) repeat protein